MTIQCPNPECASSVEVPSDAAADSRISPTKEIKTLLTFDCPKCGAALEFFEDGVLLDYAPR